MSLTPVEKLRQVVRNREERTDEVIDALLAAIDCAEATRSGDARIRGIKTLAYDTELARLETK